MDHGRIFILWLALAALPATGAGWAGAATPAEIIAEGNALLGEGRFEEAEGKFREAFEKNPSSGEAKRGLAESWAGAGLAAMKKGNLFVAANYAEKAAELYPEKAAFHFLLARVLFRQKDFYYARHVLERVLELDPESIDGLVLLGDIYYQEGLLDEALTQWEKVPQDSPQGRFLQGKIKKSRAELEVEEQLGREVSKNFTLLYDGPVPKAVTLSILGQLERTYRHIGRELGSAPPGDILVILYSRVDFRTVAARSTWAAGIYDGKIRVPVGGLSTEKYAADLRPVLTHELAHAFLWSMVERRLPLWFEEGLALYFEGPDGREERIGAPMDHSGNFPSFNHLNNALRGRDAMVVVAYNAAAEVVEFFIREEGFPVVRNILEEVATGTNFLSAFEEEVGMSSKEFYDIWIENEGEDSPGD